MAHSYRHYAKIPNSAACKMSIKWFPRKAILFISKRCKVKFYWRSFCAIFCEIYVSTSLFERLRKVQKYVGETLGNGIGNGILVFVLWWRCWICWIVIWVYIRIVWYCICTIRSIRGSFFWCSRFRFWFVRFQIRIRHHWCHYRSWFHRHCTVITNHRAVIARDWNSSFSIDIDSLGN